MNRRSGKRGWVPRDEPQRVDPGHARPSGPRRHSPTAAAFLSFVFPGLGELYAGARRRAALFGVPVLAITSWLVVRALAGLTRLAFDLFDPAFASALLAAIVVSGILRVGSIVDAYRLAAPRRAAGGAVPALVLVLAMVSVLAHGVAGLYAASFLSAGNEIFVPGGDGGTGRASPAPASGSTATPGPSDDPFAGQLSPPPTTSSRINILLLGADSGLGYDHALTDTQILVSIDPVAKTVVMASIPRDLAQLPMYSGGVYPDKINSLMTTAAANPARYPDGGVGTLSREVGSLLGVNVNYFAFINLAGFVRLIDVVGGIDVVNPADIVDPGYQFPDGRVGFFLRAGPQHLDSRIGLAFVRSRQGTGDNDYTRARRQQLVLQALKQKLLSAAMLPKIPEFLGILAKTIRTDYPAGQVGDMVALAQEIPDTAITKYVLGPPYATNPPMSETGGVWLLRPNLKVIRAWSIDVFGADSAFYAPPVPSPSPSSQP